MFKNLLQHHFFLFQMRFCLAIKDYIRTQIISKKISVRFFDKDQHQDLKLRYYQYMIELDQVSSQTDHQFNKSLLSSTETL